MRVSMLEDNESGGAPIERPRDAADCTGRLAHARTGRDMKPAPRGFTLTELMVTLAVAGILMAGGVANMRTFVQNNRLSAPPHDPLRSFPMARTGSIQRPVQLGRR